MHYEISSGQYMISTDRDRLQPDIIWKFLHDESEWARGIRYDVMNRTLQHSLNFGLYAMDGAQVGFARVVTDYGQFAYLCDIFVVASHRGQGLGKALVQAIMDHPDLQGLRRYALDAADQARSLYEQFGFVPLMANSGHMEITYRTTDLWS